MQEDGNGDELDEDKLDEETKPKKQQNKVNYFYSI